MSGAISAAAAACDNDARSARDATECSTLCQTEASLTGIVGKFAYTRQHVVLAA